MVQDPTDSLHPEMPRSELRVVEPDFSLPLKEVGPIVRDLARGVAEVDLLRKAEERNEHARVLRDLLVNGQRD